MDRKRQCYGLKAKQMSKVPKSYSASSSGSSGRTAGSLLDAEQDF